MRDLGSSATSRRRGGTALLVGVLMLLALPVFASQASAALSLTPLPTFTTSQDELGADDQPGQKDLSLQGIATPNPGELWTMWQWDDTTLSGKNTFDACSLFDTNNNAKVNYAVCVTVIGQPPLQQTGSPRVFQCGDGKVDRCSSTSTQDLTINTACATNTNANDPFHTTPQLKDMQAICHIDLADVGGTASAKLVNTCSYPSSSPTSDPSDCVFIPRDAFVVISKNASPNSGSFPFTLGTGATTANPVVFTAAGTQTSAPIAIVSGTAQTLKENVPSGWTIDTPDPVCTGASGANTSNGTLSTSRDTITGIKAASDQVVTCTYYDKQQTGAINIVKQRSGTTTKLTGAEFSIDGAGTFTTAGTGGSVCQGGLSLGNHTVTETKAPVGHDLPAVADRTQTVTVTAGTCAAGAVTATFNDPVVPGTVNVHKTDANGTALMGATFTLYVDSLTVGGTRTAGDTITTKTCTTDVSGNCSITGVDPGDYWLVETTTPAGYITADDRTVNVGIGTSSGTGDTDSFTIVDAAALGTINIHKTGLGGLDLAGATFTLYIDNAPVGGSLGLEDAATARTCTTNASGVCSIGSVSAGDYWLRETTTPAGYDTADDTSVSLGLGGQANQGATASVTISDPVVPGTVVINKTGTGGVALAGAVFTLYVDNPTVGGSRTGADTITTRTCTTNASGVCSIINVTPGDYWVVETTTPAGYDTAPEQTVHVGIGATAHVGDSDSLSFVDAVVNGKVSITKTDDSTNPNPLSGAEFTLYTDVSPFGGTRSAADDTITSPVNKCTTGAGGTCDITNVPPGRYWVVETVTPNHYDTAADQAITVGIGSAAHVGDTVPVSFTDNRRHRVVVLVCHEGTDTLLSRDVTVNGVTKQSLSSVGLTDAQQKTLCDAGGASFGDISGHPDVSALVELSKVNGATG
jgi:hypothetical protein